VSVAVMVQAVVERHASALLHHVRGLVRGEVQIGLAAEANAIANGICARADRRRGSAGIATDH